MKLIIDSSISKDMIGKYITLIKMFEMNDGSSPNLTVGKHYKVAGVYEGDGLWIMNDIGRQHSFDADDEDFATSEHFNIVPDMVPAND